MLGERRCCMDAVGFFNVYLSVEHVFFLFWLYTLCSCCCGRDQWVRVVRCKKTVVPIFTIQTLSLSLNINKYLVEMSCNRSSVCLFQSLFSFPSHSRSSTERRSIFMKSELAYLRMLLLQLLVLLKDN